MTIDDFKAALSALTKDDMTIDGAPKMKPLNDALKAAGHDEITAEIRDQLLTEIEAEIVEDASANEVTLKITEANCDPVPLHIHGVGGFRLTVGHEYTIPAEALDALQHVGGLTYEIIEDEA